MEDLLGDPKPADSGRKIDLSGASSISAQPPPQRAAPSGSGGGPSSSRGGGYNGSYDGATSFGGGAPSSLGPSSRGPTSFEGGGGGSSFSLSALNPVDIARQLASRPMTDLVAEQTRNLASLPRIAARAYESAARRYLRPWSEFARIRPQRVLEGFRSASRRGEIQVYVQRNVLANAKSFCPNYIFMFLATLFMFVCTSPMLLVMLAGVGGGWNHAMRSEDFKNKPWHLQIGGVAVPLGSNAKMAIMSLPTLFLLHFFMGPVLWSAALCSGGASLAHAAIRDRDDDEEDDRDEHGVPRARIGDMA